MRGLVKIHATPLLQINLRTTSTKQTSSTHILFYSHSHKKKIIYWNLSACILFLAYLLYIASNTPVHLTQVSCANVHLFLFHLKPHQSSSSKHTPLHHPHHQVATTICMLPVSFQHVQPKKILQICKLLLLQSYFFFLSLLFFFQLHKEIHLTILGTRGMALPTQVCTHAFVIWIIQSLNLKLPPVNYIS